MKLGLAAAASTMLMACVALVVVLTPVCANERVWIDADPACGHSCTSDPDDCLAIMALVRAHNIKVVGMSTVFGNAEIEVTDGIARDLGRRLAAEGIAVPHIYTGAASPRDRPSSATDHLTQTLAEGPLTIAAFGPLTNVSHVLTLHPRLQANVTRVVAVMGKRDGHIFHPAEGSRDAFLGHGPVFADFNFAKDPQAVRALLETDVPVVLMPYEVARQFIMTGEDLDRLAVRGGSTAWLAMQARGWLDIWRRFMGREGFYPFDLLAAEYVLSQNGFRCSPEFSRVTRRMRLMGGGLRALTVGPPRRSRDQSGRLVTYCVEIEPTVHDRVQRRLSN
jgi:inosine-uridine nucleoside N-ribohydrolase